MLVGLAVVFGLIVLWPERADVWYLNDASIHRSMVRWASDRMRDGHLPFDGWYPYLSLGASRFHHYQSLPHIATGTLSLAFGEGVFRWSLYLLLATWPVAVYAGGRMMGLGRWPAAAAAAISPLIASAPGLGYEWSSYVWRGSGTWAQLWGMWALPFAWGSSWRAIATGRRVWLAALILGVTICLHLLTGYLAMCSLAVFVVVMPREILRRLVRAVAVALGALAVAAWMLVPLLTDAGWTVNDEFSRGTYFYDSFGAGKILGWLVRGELFDQGRLPVVSVLLAVGVVFTTIQARRKEAPRVILGVGLLSLVLFFGRSTLGPVMDLLPGGQELFLRRFISGVHLAGIYVAGIGAVYLFSLIVDVLRRREGTRRIALAVAIFAGLVVLMPAGLERVGYERQGGVWIDEQLAQQATDGVGFEALVDRTRSLGPGRVFAGIRRGTRPSYRIGQVPGFAASLNLQADAIGFTRPTWSLMSPSEYRFQIDNPTHPPLFGVRYVIQPKGDEVAGAELVATSGRHALWMFPDTDYLAVVDTIAPIAADRLNIGTQMASVLDSGLPGRGFLPTVAFGGRPGAVPTLGRNELPSSSPGEVLESFAGPSDGVFGGTVRAERNAVVLVKASFDPRWTAFVDGEEVPTQVVAPGMLGVPIAAGEHEVYVVYESYPWYPPLFALGIAVVVAMWLVERLLRTRRARLDLDTGSAVAR